MPDDIIAFVEKCDIKLSRYQKEFIKMIRAIQLKSRQLGGSRLRFKRIPSTFEVMTASAEEPPALGHDAFMTSPLQTFEHYNIVLDLEGPETESTDQEDPKEPK